MSTTQMADCSVIGVLYVSVELANKRWKVTSATSFGQRPRLRTVAAADLVALEEEFGRAKRRFNLPDDAKMLSCFEAGRDGLWLHRWLESVGVVNIVVDPGSLARARRRGAPKTDRIDGEKLLQLLIRYTAGERDACRVVRVPSQADEDARHPRRELATLKGDRTRHINRIKSYLVSQGLPAVSLGKNFLERLGTLRRWDGSLLPADLHERIGREYERLQQVRSHITTLEKQRRQAVQEAKNAGMQCARKLMQVKGIGINGATVLGLEVFGWRRFRNRREVGAFPGLAPNANQSGDTSRDTSITRRGSRELRALLVELAWCWLRFQPDSEITRWFQERFASGSKRLRRIGIVAVARKLIIALWRYLETGVVPPGAILKT